MNVMINDWVSFDKDYNPQYVRVTGISENGEFIQTEETDVYYPKNVYNPSPFTPEIMEKNRFTLNKKESELLSNVHKSKVLAYDFPEVLGNRFLVEYDTQNKVAYITDHCLIPIRYVNEFQQLLRLMSNKVNQVKQVLDNFVV